MAASDPRPACPALSNLGGIGDDRTSNLKESAIDADVHEANRFIGKETEKGCDGSCESPSPRLLSELEQVEGDSGELSTRYSQEDVYADLSNEEIELSGEEPILGDRAGCEQLLYGLLKGGHNFKTVKASDLPSTGDIYDETVVDLRINDGDLLGDRLALLEDKDCRSAVRIILIYEGKHRRRSLIVS